MTNNFRFNSVYFKVNALLIQKRISEGRLKESKLYILKRFRVAEIFNSPRVLRIAATLTYKFRELYPRYSIRSILITTIPADETIPYLDLKIYYQMEECVHYSKVGKNFDAEIGDPIFIRYTFPHIGSITYEISKQEEDYFPTILDKEFFVNHRPEAIRQLHISSTHRNIFPILDLHGHFAKPRHLRLL